MKITAILLAAGRSTRMGHANKLMHPLAESSILEQSLQHLARSNVGEIILITGFEAEKISALPLVKKLASEGKLRIVINENHENGMGSSLATGINALDTQTDATLITLGDMPYIQPNSIDQIITAANAHNDKQIFIPQFNGKNGHPTLWRKPLFNQLAELSGDNGGKNIIQTHKSLSQIVAVDDQGILKDIDTLEMLDN